MLDKSKPLCTMQVERGVFTAGAKATQRSEGLNKVVKSTLGKGSGLLQVIEAFANRAWRQSERALHSTFDQLHHKRVAGVAKQAFPQVVAELSSTCSDHALQLFDAQAAAGVTEYDILWPEIPDNQCPEPAGERTSTMLVRNSFTISFTIA
jgi:hypothetical protein